VTQPGNRVLELVKNELDTINFIFLTNMGNYIFGAPKTQVVPEKPEVSIREKIMMLEKRKSYLELLAANAQKSAKEATSKDTALRYIKSKNMYLKEIQSIHGMLEKLETLENARQRIMISKDVLDVTKQANQAIKINMMDPDKVEDFMDEMAETINQADDVTRVIGAPLTSNFEAEQELEEMLRENNAVVPPPTAVPMPLPPTKLPTQEKTVEEIRMLIPS